MEASLEVLDVRKAYGDFVAVDSLSLAVPPGTIFGLLGPNGAGKTTTIRMIMDIIAPDSGAVHFMGRPRTTVDLHRIGYLPEERGLYRKMTTLDHVVFLGELHGMSRRDAKPRAEQWIQRVGLGEWTNKKVEELSKGMQQKIQLIGTVLHEPELIILDEPFSGLDPINQGLFKEMLAEFKRDGRTILFSTHIMEQAEKLCDHICLISGGGAVLKGSLAEIKREFGGNTYRLAASGDGTGLSSIDGIEDVAAYDSHYRLLLAPDAGAPKVLARIVERMDVHEFRSEEPELEEIFIKAVRDAG
jgi:ABC-2 type transport system ATP-binding protein